MNQKAASLGCENTWFITPNGLDATELIPQEDGTMLEKVHCTTAKELARILAYCIRESPCRDTFLEITRTGNYSFSANGRSYSCVNHNAFLSMMEGALTGKTGFTNKAGYCYVGALERDGRTFVVALLACGWPNNKTYKWSDTRKLMQYGLDNYYYRSFSEAGIAFDEKKLNPIFVLNGQTEQLGEDAYMKVVVDGRAEGGARAGDNNVQRENGMEGRNLDGLLLRGDEQVNVKYTLAERLTAPVVKGTPVGSITYMVGDTVYRTETIITADNLKAIDPQWCLLRILGRFLLP